MDEDCGDEVSRLLAIINDEATSTTEGQRESSVEVLRGLLRCRHPPQGGGLSLLFGHGRYSTVWYVQQRHAACGNHIISLLHLIT